MFLTAQQIHDRVFETLNAKVTTTDSSSVREAREAMLTMLAMRSNEIASAPRIGEACPVFLLGAGANIEQHGLNQTVLERGWAHFVSEAWTHIQRFYDGLPVIDGSNVRGRRVMFHLPHGRSPVADGPLADMPLDGLPRLQLAARRGRKDLAKAADDREFVNSISELIVRTGIRAEFYVGTCDHGHADQWSRMEPRALASYVEASLGVYRQIQRRTGARIRVWLDAAGVVGPNSNSWAVAMMAWRMGLDVGVEPWISHEGRVWADHPRVHTLVTSQLMDHIHDDWAVDRNEIMGDIAILHNEGDPADEAQQARIVGWLKNEYDVFVGGFDPKITAARWREMTQATQGVTT